MSEFDPTTNRIQFGLLSEDEQTTLIRWPHGFEFWWEDEWTFCAPAWITETVYRGKPAPVVTSAWHNIYPSWECLNYHPSRKYADERCSPHRIAVLRIDTCEGVSTAHLEDV